MSKSHKGYREVSRCDWGRSHEEGAPLNKTFNNADIQLGALLRIADATEAMAKNWRQLVAERDEAVASRDRAFERERKLEYRVAALRGVITRMKRGSRA